MKSKGSKALRCSAAACLLSALAPLAMAEQPLGPRTPILLDAVERQFLQTEMHLNLRALQVIYASLAGKDPARASEAAASRGMSTFGDKDPSRPRTLTAKLPPAWRAMAGAGRAGFDELAAGLAAREPEAVTFGRLARLHENCNACHAVFRLDELR